MTATAERSSALPPLSVRTARRTAVASLPTWPLAVAFTAYPLWWVSGAGWLAWPIVAVLMIAQLARAGTWQVPPGFWIWLVYLGSTFVSLLEVQGGSGYFSWAFNESGYIAATVFFVYIYNMPRSARLLPRYLALFWLITILGGLLGVFFPHAGFSTPVRHILPNSITSNALADRFTDLHFGDYSGYGNVRPEAPFAYANRWGSVLALTTPIAVMVALRTRRSDRRSIIILASFVALLPIVYSLDRGLWASIGIAVMYALFRSIRRGRGKALVGLVIAMIAVGIAVVASSLHSLAISKVTNAYSDNGRIESYGATWSGFLDKPWFGHGTTGGSTGVVTNGHVPVGTQGQFWTAIYTGGLLATIPFFLWFIYVLVKTARQSSALAAVYRISCFLPLLLSFVYGFVPETLMIIMVCQAALLNLHREDPPKPRPNTRTIAGALHRLPATTVLPNGAAPPKEVLPLVATGPNRLLPMAGMRKPKAPKRRINPAGWDQPPSASQQRSSEPPR